MHFDFPTYIINPLFTLLSLLNLVSALHVRFLSSVTVPSACCCSSFQLLLSKNQDALCLLPLRQDDEPSTADTDGHGL